MATDELSQIHLHSEISVLKKTIGALRIKLEKVYYDAKKRSQLVEQNYRQEIESLKNTTSLLRDDIESNREVDSRLFAQERSKSSKEIHQLQEIICQQRTKMEQLIHDKERDKHLVLSKHCSELNSLKETIIALRTGLNEYE